MIATAAARPLEIMRLNIEFPLSSVCCYCPIAGGALVTRESAGSPGRAVW